MSVVFVSVDDLLLLLLVPLSGSDDFAPKENKEVEEAAVVAALPKLKIFGATADVLVAANDPRPAKGLAPAFRSLSGRSGGRLALTRRRATVCVLNEVNVRRIYS